MQLDKNIFKIQTKNRKSTNKVLGQSFIPIYRNVSIFSLEFLGEFIRTQKKKKTKKSDDVDFNTNYDDYNNNNYVRVHK